MANAFDQFDSNSNAFDQFDEGAQRRTPRTMREQPQQQPQDQISQALNRSGVGRLADAALSFGSGMIAGPASGYSGLLGTVLPGPKGQGADWAQRTQENLTIQPRTEFGKGANTVVSYPFVKLSELADWAGGKTTDKTGSPAIGTGVNAGIQALPMLLGRYAPLPKEVKPSTPSPADMSATWAKQRGMSLPLSQVNPSFMNKMLEGAGGKIKTAQDFSIKNQPLSNEIIRERYGIPKDVPLDVDALKNVRQIAGESYERVRGSGRVTASSAYGEALDKIAAPFERAAKDFPESAKTDILNAVKAARKGEFDASSAVDQISILRGEADKAYAAKDKKLGGAYKSIAEAMENELDRHITELSKTDKRYTPQDVQEFRNARRTIAETYTVGRHLSESGNIDVVGLSKELKKEPLQGEIKKLAEFGKNYPKAAQLPEKIGGVPQSPIDWGFSLASLGTAIASGQPLVAAGAAAPFFRPPLRSAIGSDWYQNRFVNPPVSGGPSTLSRIMQAQRNPWLQGAEMAEEQRR